MPPKNSTKLYVENGYYHIYNRGVEKRLIFEDEQDYGIFLGYLKDYLLARDDKALLAKLSNPGISGEEKDKILSYLRLKNFHPEITLIAYCLMPNHFHLFLQQRSPGSIDQFMNSLASRYATFFNRKYQRVGSLYQGVYKAVLVANDAQFVYLSRYIHRQALKVNGHSSYPEYMGTRRTPWVHPEQILACFSSNVAGLSYQDFVTQAPPEAFQQLGLELEEPEDA